MIPTARQSRGVLAGLLLLLALPGTALAAAPDVTTGAASAITQSTATVKGSVTPNGNTVTAFFQYGGNRLYGGKSVPVTVAPGGGRTTVSASLSGLAPYTTYHYRLVSQDGNRLVFGKDRTFRTERQPLGLTLVASPSSVKVGGATTLSGNLSGTGNAGKLVQFQQQPFGSTAFVNVGNQQKVDAAGNFSLPVLGVTVNTAYRVVLPNRQDIVSPVVFVVVPLHATMKVDKHVKTGRRGTFKGTVSPSVPGAQVLIQNKFHGVWVTIAKTKVKKGGKHFVRRPKLKRGGSFRAVVTPVAGAQGYVPDTTTVKHIKVRKRYKK